MEYENIGIDEMRTKLKNHIVTQIKEEEKTYEREKKIQINKRSKQRTHRRETKGSI